jgi:hypothetical protein
MLDQIYRNRDTDFSGGTAAPRILGHQDFMLPARVYLRVTSSDTNNIPSNSTESEFKRLAKEWIHDTKYLSSPSEKYLHPSYAQIIGLGPSVVPLILEELRRRPDDWFYALRAITRADPVTSTMAGDMGKMKKAWLAWGAGQGLV